MNDKREESGALLDELGARIGAAVGLSVAPVAPPASARRRLMERVAREPHFIVKPGVTGTRSSRLDWTATPIPGIEEKVIARDAQRAVTTRLIRFAAGTRYPNHRHGATEEIFVLEGSISVNGVLLSSGDYCRSEAGTEELGTVSETGGLAIVISSDRDEIDIPPQTP
jgi:anti-sigma factor ChrR (cupin superfamily)